jgi:hypothetical protein
MPVLPLALLVTIRLYDSSGMPAADLRAALRTAETALRSAAIAPAWVVCPPPGAGPADNSTGCPGVPHESELLVRIVRAPATVVSTDTLGYAAVDAAAGRGTLATIFADRIARFAARAGMDRSTLGGYAIAHEIGHLLLGAAHAPHGLMRAAWTPGEMLRRLPSDWKFSREDAARLVSAADRTAAPAPALPESTRADRSSSGAASENPLEAPDRPSERTPSTPPAPPLPTSAALRAR